MTALTHAPSPLFASAETCGHPVPLPASGPAAFAEWQADHPYGTAGTDRSRICLDTPAGFCCLACTEYALEERDLPTDQYIDFADCTHAAVTG